MPARAIAAVEHLRNSRFEEWAAGFPTIWSRISSTGATYRQLLKTDPLDHPQRRTFESFASVKACDQDYIWGAGESGCRISLAASVVANDWIIRQEAAATRGIEVFPGQSYRPVVTARNSIENNLLRVQVIGILGTTDTLWLTPDPEAINVSGGVSTGVYLPGRGGFQWATSETNILLQMKPFWQRVGLQADIPLGIDSISVRLSNGSAGAQVIDLGEVSLVEISDRVGGAR